ncbi:MAG: hypothetical protein ACRDOM_00110 [Nocardioides sp.]
MFLHIGSPKTGTTFLQQVLWSQRELAAQQGVWLPLGRFHDHYLASLDLRGLAGPPHPPASRGMWKRLVEETAGRSGSMLVSHELFAAANAEQARRATTAFGPEVEVHVILTVRDLLRQMSAEWQEHVKHRSPWRFDEFVDSVRKGAPNRSGWFWKVQDYVGLVERWGEGLPPSRVHVVTVPPAGSSSGLLWRRFAGLLCLDPDAFDTSTSRANTSLGLEQTELLRRVNVALGDRLPLPGPYPGVVKNVLAHQVLAGRPGSPLRLEATDVDFAVEQSGRLADGLADAGVDVVGSLDDLRIDHATAQAAVSSGGYVLPDDPVLLEESIGVLSDLLVALSERIQRNRAAAERVRALRQAPLRTALRVHAERHPSLNRARRAWRRLRRR